MKDDFDRTPEASFMQIPREYGCVGNVPNKVRVEFRDQGGILSDLDCIVLYIGTIEMNCYPFWGVFCVSGEHAAAARKEEYCEHLYVITGLLVPALGMLFDASHLYWMSEDQWTAFVRNEKEKRGNLWISNLLV
jgi:hypothetical protein